LKKNNLKKIILILFAILFMACSSSVEESYSTGEEVYEARCSACHGKDFEGRVGPALDAASQSASMPDSYWVQTITKGKGSMPAQRLTDNEVTMVIEYIRSNH
jgi:mono/diheme cytochrome c family protein